MGASPQIRNRLRARRLMKVVAGATLALAAVLTSLTAVPAAEPADEQARIAAVSRPAQDFSKAERYERRPAGKATVFKPLNRDSFSHPSANMPFARERDFRVGNGIFRKVWVSSPSSTTSSDGLGPLFNARACQRCHLKDGRGRPPAAGERAETMFLRLSIPPQTANDREALREHRQTVIPEPTYGGQLQNFSVQGVLAEGEMTIAYEETSLALADGETVSLRAPTYGVSGLHYGPFHPETMLSPRVAPPIIGMGLLEAITEADILAGADPEDRDGDGISGRANRVWSDEHGKPMLGRFGWKAGQPTVSQQSAGAFRGDVGISTPLYRSPYGDCTATQETCRDAPHGGASAQNTVEASLQLTFDVNLKPVIGESAQDVRPVLAESRLSGRSQRNIVVTLETLQALYLGEGSAGLGDLAAGADPKLDRLMRKAFRLTLATARSIDGSVENAAGDPALRPPVEKLATQVQALKQIVRDRLAPALGLAVGFNALDGD